MLDLICRKMVNVYRGFKKKFWRRHNYPFEEYVQSARGYQLLPFPEILILPDYFLVLLHPWGY